MDTADHLLDLIYSWMEQRQRCAEKLRKLARDLESLREKCNGTECVGSSVSVVAASLIVAGVLTVCTGGAAAPFLGLAGTVSSVVGVSISVAAKLTEHFLSSDTMEEAKKVDNKSKEIGEKIQKLFKQMKAERKKLSPFADPDELDQHIMTEFLLAIGKRSGVKGKITVRDVNNEPTFYLDVGQRYKMINFNIAKNRNEPWGLKMLTFNNVVTDSVVGILVFFAMEAGGKKSKFLFAKGAQQLIKLMSLNAFKSAVKGGAMVVGGAVGMAFALSEAIDNWTDLIKNNHVTETSKSLRDTANDILDSTTKLRNLIDDIKREFEKMAERQRQLEAERRRQLEAERRQLEAERRRQLEAERRQLEAERQRQLEAEKRRQLQAERRQLEAERQRQLEAEKRRQLQAEKRRQCEEKRKRDAANPGGFSVMLCVIAGLVLSTYCWKQLMTNSFKTEAAESVRENTKTREIKETTPAYAAGDLRTCAETETDQRHEDEQESDGAEQSRQKQEMQSNQKEESDAGHQAGGGQGDEGSDGEDEESDQEDEESDQEDEESDQEDEESESEEETDNEKKKKTKQDHQSGGNQEGVCSVNEESHQEFETNLNRPINVVLLNLRSMRRFNMTVRVLELITRYHASIFLTTETWLNSTNVQRFLREASPVNFRYFYFTRASRGGGVAIQFSPQLQGQQIVFNWDITGFEFVAAVLQHVDWDDRVLIITLYRPPRCSVKEFLKALQNVLNEVSNKYKRIIITGDFNIWVDDPKRGRRFQSFLQNNNLVQCVREPTHRGNHTLDLVLTRNVEVSDVEVRNDGMSDHFTVFFKARPEKTEENEDGDENRKRYKKSEE